MNPRDEIAELLRIAAGDLDALTAEQVARLGEALDEDPSLAAKLGGQVALLKGWLADAVAEADRAARPSPQEWDRVWAGIEAAGAAGTLRAERARVRIIRLGLRPLAAAAACLVLAAVWRYAAAPAVAADTWPLRLASEVVIDELEVADGVMPFVFAAGRNGGGEVIWLLQTPS